MRGKTKGLGARYKHSEETKDYGGAQGSHAFDWKKVSKEKVNFFTPKEGTNKIAIIPYEVKSKNHPLVRSKEMEIGDLDAVMDLYIHRGIGPNNSSVVCLKRNFGKACPICEQADEFKNAGKEKEFNQLKPSRRCLYNIVDMVNPDKGVQVFDVSQFLFEKELIDEARNAAKSDGDFVNYAAPGMEGKIIKFRASKESFQKAEYFEFKSFGFIDREEEDWDEDWLESAISFDEAMIVPTYEEAGNILFGQDEDAEEEDDPKPAKKSRHADDDEEEDPKPKKKARDEEEDEPKAKKSRHAEEDEEDEPKPKKKKDPMDDEDVPPAKAKAAGTCPDGGVFGKDVDTRDACDDCKEWEKCARAKKEMKK